MTDLALGEGIYKAKVFLRRESWYSDDPHAIADI